MSGGLFFSNPTAGRLPPAAAHDGDNERRGTVGVGCGAIPGQIVNNGFNAAVPFNAAVTFNNQQQPQQLMNDIQVGYGGVPDPLADLNSAGNGGNAGSINNPLQNASATSGLGSFFFNPLALFTTKNNNSTVGGALSNAPMANDPLAAAANAAPAANALVANFLSVNAAPNDGCPASAMPNEKNLANNDLLENSRAKQKQQQQQQQQQGKQAEASSPPADAASQSLLQRPISSMGSALAGIAAYVNQSFLSGIPFHVTDRAMKESKAAYAKWWEDGINGDGTNNEGTDEEDGDDGNGDGAAGSRRRGKRRRLDSSGNSAGSGSVLSKSLRRYYDDMGLDTSGSFAESRPARPPILQVQPPIIEVDSSIIAPRRRNQFEKSSAAAVSSSSSLFAQRPGGYDAFNNIGGMYDFDGSDAQLPEEQNLRGIDSTYNSLGGHYATNEDLEENTNDRNNNDDVASATAADDSAISPAEENARAAAVTPPISDEETSPVPLLDGTMNALQALLEEKNRLSEEKEMLQMISSPREWVKKSVRSELIDALQAAQGDVTDKRFLSSLEVLGNFYKTGGRDARVSPWSSGRRRPNASETGVGGGDSNGDIHGYGGKGDEEMGGPTASDLLEGRWVNMSRPNYVECLGQNSENDFLYTLGRMSFDMFQPGNLVCSVQNTHNTIKIVGEREELPAFVPKSLKEEVASLCDSALVGGGATRRPLLRSYDIAVSLTIEIPESVGQPNPPATPTPTKRLRAVQSVKGYILPDPEIPNRLTVWFTGGKMSPARLPSDGDEEDTDNEDQPEYNQNEDKYGDFSHWKTIFDKGNSRKPLVDRARAMAAKLLLGADVPNKMEKDGHMEYTLHRPVGEHGKIYLDVLYLDEDILIMRGHHGTIFAMARSN